MIANLVFVVSCEIEDGWENSWVVSDWKKDENTAGVWNHTSGKWNGDPNDKGIFF
jgi:calreticulin